MYQDIQGRQNNSLPQKNTGLVLKLNISILFVEFLREIKETVLKFTSI